MKRLLIGLFVLGLASELGAQQVPARLSLEDALRIARVNNPAVRRAANDVDVASAEERRAFAAFLPNLNASLNFSGSKSRSLTGRGNFDEPIERPDFIEFTSSSASQGISLQMTLFDGGQTWQRLRSSRSNARAVTARVDREMLQLEADVTRRYFEAVRAQQRIRLEERLLASRRDQLEVTERQLRVVASGPVDVLGAQVDLATQEQAVAQARGDAAKQMLLLAEAMGIEGELDAELVDALPPIFEPSVLDAEALVALALEASPRIRELEASLAAARQSASAARASRLPSISATTSFGRSISRSELDAFFEMNPPNRGLSFSIGASVPLFSRYQTTAAIVQADVARANAEENLRAGRIAVEREIRSALIDLENAYRSVQLADRSAELSAARLEMAREQYRAGARNFTEIQAVADQAARAEREAVERRFAFVSALIDLELRVGRRVRP